jgi:hypothetical protein
MNNNVKPEKSTKNSNLSQVLVTGSILRCRAYAWHLDAAGRHAACNAIFHEVSGGKTGECTAPLLDWLSASEWLGMRMLLGHIANRSKSSGLDEAAIFNKVNLDPEEPVFANISDGGHLSRFLSCMASSRMVDLARQSGRVVLFEDCGEDDLRSFKNFESIAGACDEVERREKQAIISHLVRISSMAKGSVLADAVFARYVESCDTITQADLGREFHITQCQVNRILTKKRNELREALERELQITLQVKTRKPRKGKKQVAMMDPDLDPHQPALDVA